MSQDMQGFIERHSIAAKEPVEDPKLSPEGVQVAQEAGRTRLREIVEHAPPSAIIAMLGVSELQRTDETEAATIAGLKESFLAEPDPAAIVFDTAEIRARAKEGLGTAIRSMQKDVDANPDKKFVLGVPLQMKELDMLSEFYTRGPDGRSLKDKNPYYDEVMKRAGGDADKALFLWLHEAAAAGDDFPGMNARKLGKNILAALQRLKTFVEKYAPKDRPIILGVVTHSWGIDAALATLMGGGELNEQGVQALEATGAKIISTAGIAEIKIGQGEISVNYRGKDYQVPQNET